MSIDEKKLRDDLEAYLRGEAPPPNEFAAAPRIENWTPAITNSPEGRGMKLVGFVAGHPTLADKRRIETSPVAWIDRRLRWARTRSRVFALGKPAGGDGDT